MNTKFSILLSLAILVFVTACSDNKAVMVDSHLCKSELPFTKLEAGAFTIKIFEPNDAIHPDVWQGPLCISNAKTGSICGFDLSLIKSVTPDRNNSYIDVGVFSSSSSWSYKIELGACISKK